MPLPPTGDPDDPDSLSNLLRFSGWFTVRNYPRCPVEEGTVDRIDLGRQAPILA
ncbi:hypothetical protein [Methylohalobius crimeensis]|uniref:hypothetical protein n=1 Tax=Methylohalobius crimeensis TaxID=244365 RepID=UPI0003B613AB|nr:hypothetical protein [Methylohalobius crimeensis]